MKLFVILAITPLILAVAGVAAVQAAPCPCDTNATLIDSDGAGLAAYLGGNTVCAAMHSNDALAPWQEYQSGTTATGGPLIRYPSQVVGSWSTTGTGVNTMAIYNYAANGTYQYAVCQSGATTTFCGAIYGGRNIVATLRAGAVSCGLDAQYEIWGWKGSQVSKEFVADGGDWESQGVGIDAGEVVLGASCSAEKVSCVKDSNCPPAAPAGTGIAGPLNVAIRTKNGYLLHEVQMDAEESPDAIPQTGTGNPKVGKFETKASWDILSPASGWSSDTDDDMSDGKTSYIALHGTVFVPSGCDVYQGNGYSAFCSETVFGTAAEACGYELQNCSGDGAWADGRQFAEGVPGNWAMYMAVDASNFCSFEKICDSSDGVSCN